MASLILPSSTVRLSSLAEQNRLAVIAPQLGYNVPFDNSILSITDVSKNAGGFSFNSTNSQILFDYDIFRKQEFIVCLVFRRLNTNAATQFMVDSRFVIGDSVEGLPANKIGVTWYNGAFNTLSLPVPNTEYIKVLVCFDGNSRRLYANEVLTETTTSGGIIYVSGPDRGSSLGKSWTGTGIGLSGSELQLFGYFNYSSELENKLAESPWQIFAPQKRIVYFDVGAGGAYTLASADGTFVVSGQATGLLATRVLPSSTASYSLSGQIAALLAGKTLASEASSFALAGQTTGLLSGKLLAASAGSFTLNGQSATLTYVPNSAAYVLTAANGTFLFSGQAAQLITGRLLTSSAAAFTLVGQDAALLAGRKLTSSEAAFTLDGVAVTLLAGRLLTASEAAYSLAGQNATLIYTPVGAYILAANAATYNVSGQAALLLHSRILAGAEGSFVVSGINAGMLKGLRLSAAASAFLLSGRDITFAYTQGYMLTCATGSYILSGQDAALITERILTLSAAGFTLTGKDAALRTGVSVPVAIGDPDWQIIIKAFDHRTAIEAFDHRTAIEAFDQRTVAEGGKHRVIIH
jgi:hypothetical protein